MRSDDLLRWIVISTNGVCHPRTIPVLDSVAVLMMRTQGPSSAVKAAARRRYSLVCTLLGFALGWLPLFMHGPIPQKFNVLYIRGAVAVWGYYSARLLIGFLVGITRWPAPWYLRGPMCGLLMMFPLTLISLAMPGCGWP